MEHAWKFYTQGNVNFSMWTRGRVSLPKVVGRPNLFLMHKVVINKRLQYSVCQSQQTKEQSKMPRYGLLAEPLTCRTSFTDCRTTPFLGASFSMSWHSSCHKPYLHEMHTANKASGKAVP